MCDDIQATARRPPRSRRRDHPGRARRRVRADGDLRRAGRRPDDDLPAATPVRLRPRVSDTRRRLDQDPRPTQPVVPGPARCGRCHPCVRDRAPDAPRVEPRAVPVVGRARRRAARTRRSDRGTDRAARRRDRARRARPASASRGCCAAADGRAAGVGALTGRAVPVESPVPFRPLTEAFLAAFRSRAVPDDPTLAGFEGHLGRLVPTWRTSDASRRLAAAARRGGGAPARRARRRTPVACSCSRTSTGPTSRRWRSSSTWAMPSATRAAGASSRRDRRTRPRTMVRRLERRRAGRRRADRRARRRRRVDAWSPRASDAERRPGRRWWSSCERTPTATRFLVEELLAGLIAAGALARVDEHWEIVGLLTVDVPASLRELGRPPPRRSRPAASPGGRRGGAARALASSGSCSPASPRSTAGRPSRRCGPRSTRS